MLLAIDSGACTGWAIFDGKDLLSCGLDTPYDCFITTVIIECPRLRPRGEKNPNSILLVARNAGEWGGRYAALGAEVRYVTPNEWKGATPKNVSEARTKSALSSEELAIVYQAFKTAKGRSGMAKSLRNNVWDAIGIGLYAVGR